MALWLAACSAGHAEPVLLERFENLRASDDLDGMVKRRFVRALVVSVELFKKYGDEYGFDPLLLAAQAYQESGLDQRKLSPSGALGVMRLIYSLLERQLRTREQVRGATP